MARPMDVYLTWNRFDEIEQFIFNGELVGTEEGRIGYYYRCCVQYM